MGHQYMHQWFFNHYLYILVSHIKKAIVCFVWNHHYVHMQHKVYNMVIVTTLRSPCLNGNINIHISSFYDFLITIIFFSITFRNDDYIYWIFNKFWLLLYYGDYTLMVIETNQVLFACDLCSLLYFPVLYLDLMKVYI